MPSKKKFWKLSNDPESNKGEATVTSMADKKKKSSETPKVPDHPPNSSSGENDEAEILGPSDTQVTSDSKDENLWRFQYGHLPQHLQEVSAPFFGLAQDLLYRLPDGPDKELALRRLFESKNYAVMSDLSNRGPGS